VYDKLGTNQENKTTGTWDDRPTRE